MMIQGIAVVLNHNAMIDGTKGQWYKSISSPSRIKVRNHEEYDR